MVGWEAKRPLSHTHRALALVHHRLPGNGCGRASSLVATLDWHGPLGDVLAAVDRPEGGGLRRRARQGHPALRLARDHEHGPAIASPSPGRIGSAGRARISMDGTGRYLDTVVIERLWRSPKHESVSLHARQTGSQAHTGPRTRFDV